VHSSGVRQPKVEAQCIGIVGAERTGRTKLATTLTRRPAVDTERRVAGVPEVPRNWSGRSGRWSALDGADHELGVEGHLTEAVLESVALAQHQHH
jgi:hypothetical protein